MWFRRVMPLAFILLIQLLIIASELNERQADPTDIDNSWAATLAPLIVYLAGAGIFILSTFVYSIVLWLTPDARSSADDTDDDSSGQPQQQYGGASRIVETNKRTVLARIYLCNALVDTALLIPLAVFVGLLIDQLELIDDGVPDNERLWMAVFAPLFTALLVMLIVLFLAAIRVCGEANYQRPLSNSECCSAGCAGVLVCCPTDLEYAAQAEVQRRDKRVDYIADGAYHELPCVFIFTPSMTYGCGDFILAWVLFLFVIVLIGTLIGVAALLDGTIASELDVVFVGLYVDEALMILFAIFSLVGLCIYWRGSNQRPAGRKSVSAKAYEALFVITLSALLIAQQSLLAEQKSPQSWFVVFIPAYILFSIMLFVGCCDLRCAGRSNNDVTIDVTIPAQPATRTRSTGAQYKAGPGSFAKATPHHKSSVYGAFQ
jgi:hypothetical protein